MLAIVFAIIGVVLWLAFDAKPYWAAVLAATFAGLALTTPGLLLPLNRLWGVFARRLGHVNNYLLLSLVYYLLVLPTGLVMRCFGADPMSRTIDREAESYWMPVERRATAETFKDMF